MSFQPKTKTKQWETRAGIYGLLINYSVPQVKVFRDKNFRLHTKISFMFFFFPPICQFWDLELILLRNMSSFRPASFGCSLVTGDLHSGSLHVFDLTEFYAGRPSRHNSYCLKVLSHPPFPHTSILGSMWSIHFVCLHACWQSIIQTFQHVIFKCFTMTNTKNSSSWFNFGGNRVKNKDSDQ